MIKKIHSEIVYSNPWISVAKDTVQFSDEKLGEYGVIHHKNRSVVVIVEKDDRFLVLEVFRYVLSKSFLEFPAGGIDDNETPEEAAFREVMEEVGIEINNIKILGSYYPSNGTSDQEVFVIMSDYCCGTLCPDLNEVSKADWLDKKSFFKLIQNGTIVDGLTITAMAFVNIISEKNE